MMFYKYWRRSCIDVYTLAATARCIRCSSSGPAWMKLRQHGKMRKLSSSASQKHRLGDKPTPREGGGGGFQHPPPWGAPKYFKAQKRVAVKACVVIS